jgi:hypothetical protein
MTANKIAIQPAVVSAPAVAAPAAVEPAKIDEQTSAQPASAPSVASTASTAMPQQAYYVGAALAASILILLGAGVLLKRRTASQRST